MYSHELDSYFKKNNYYFNSFYEFEIVRSSSPQVRYNICSDDGNIIKLNVFTYDNYQWDIYIKKEDVH